MKKLALVLASCAVLALTFASCTSTRGTVEGHSAATGTSSPAANPEVEK